MENDKIKALCKYKNMSYLLKKAFMAPDNKRRSAIEG